MAGNKREDVQANQLSLPTNYWRSSEDIRLYAESNEMKKTAKLDKTIDVGETMKNLSIISSAMKLAIAASHGYACNTMTIDMLSCFQTLIKDSSLAIDAFLNASVDAVRLHQMALQILAKGHEKAALQLLSHIAGMAGEMAAKADKLVQESSSLVKLGEVARSSTTSDRDETLKERSQAETSIADFKLTAETLKTLKSELRQKVIEASEQEQEAVEIASTDRHQRYIVDLHGGGFFGFLFGNRRTTADPSSAQQRELMLTQERIDLQKQELRACAELTEAVAKLKTTHSLKNELDRAVHSLDVAVKALGRITTTFKNTYVFWEQNRKRAEEMGDNATQALDRIMKLPDEVREILPDMLLQEITTQGFKWMALGETNYKAMKAIKNADASVDSVMSNLPTTTEVGKIVEEELPKLMEVLKEEQAQLEKGIAYDTAKVSA